MIAQQSVGSVLTRALDDDDDDEDEDDLFNQDDEMSIFGIGTVVK